MTKFILHGGRVKSPTGENHNFFDAVLDSVNNVQVRILVIPFAREESRWEEKFREIQTLFLACENEGNLHISLASLSTQNVINEIQNSDIIFILGGNTQRLQRKLDEIKNLRELLSKKVVAGSSAGALVFSRFYYENDTNEFYSGLGFLSVGMICHWHNQEKELDYIKKYGSVDEVLCIAEGEFLIREI